MSEQEKVAASVKGYDSFLAVDKKVRGVFRFFCNLSAIALAVIMLVAVINLIGEKLASAGAAWASGLPNSNFVIQYFHIPLVFLAAGYVTLDQGHTRIDLLIHRWPLVEKICMVIGHVLGAIVSFFISYRGVVGTLLKDFDKHMRIASTASSMQRWPFTICHCLGFFLLGLSFIWALVRMYKFWKLEGVNPGVYLYPDEQHGPGGPAPEEEEVPEA